MEIDKVSPHLYSLATSQYLIQHVSVTWLRAYPRSVSSWLKHWLFSKCSFSEKSTPVMLGLYFISPPAAQHSPARPSSPHIILIMFLSSPASSLTGYQIISQTDSRHEAVGGDQLRPHYDLSNKNSLQGWFISDLTRWQHRTQLDLRPQTSSCYRISQADRQEIREEGQKSEKHVIIIIILQADTDFTVKFYIIILALPRVHNVQVVR